MEKVVLKIDKTAQCRAVLSIFSILFILFVYGRFLLSMQQ